jgi:hypothetical protein
MIPERKMEPLRPPMAAPASSSGRAAREAVKSETFCRGCQKRKREGWVLCTWCDAKLTYEDKMSISVFNGDGFETGFAAVLEKLARLRGGREGAENIRQSNREAPGRRLSGVGGGGRG